MAEYDLNALAEQAVDAALEHLPPVDKLLKLSYRNMLKAIIMAAAPTLEAAFYDWCIAEIKERQIDGDASLGDADEQVAHELDRDGREGLAEG